MTIRESEVTKQCVGYLRIRGASPRRRNVGGVKRTYKGKDRYISFGTKGQSDWWMILPDGSGRHVEIEFKASDGWPTEDQIRWMIEVNELKGIAFWARDIEMMDKIYTHIMSGGLVKVLANGQIFLSDGN